MFEFNMTPTINKPTRVTKYTATAIDNIITNYIINSDFKSAIVKTDLSNHFPIVFVNELMRVPTSTDDMENCVYKRDFTENALNCFKQALFETSWDSVKNLKQPSKAYNKFIEIFTELYEEYFPIRKIKIRPKRALSPWITNGIGKLSKRKQKLYEKFLKHCTLINEANYKAYKNLFETIKRKSQKRFYSEKLINFKGDAKKTWCIIKNLLARSKSKKVDKTDILGEKNIANEFNNFFTDIGLKLAKKIPEPSQPFYQ